jgi:hypothetical protein
VIKKPRERGGHNPRLAAEPEKKIHVYVQLIITFCGPYRYVFDKHVLSREITCFSKLYFHDKFQEPTLIGAKFMSA